MHRAVLEPLVIQDHQGHLGLKDIQDRKALWVPEGSKDSMESLD